VHDETSTRLSREHNNANVIVLGERLIGELTAISCLQIFLDTEFAHGRHEKRVEKLEQSQILLTQQESLDAPR
jgi:ribose 5-phosphate isomerase B